MTTRQADRSLSCLASLFPVVSSRVLLQLSSRNGVYASRHGGCNVFAGTPQPRQWSEWRRNHWSSLLIPLVRLPPPERLARCCIPLGLSDVPKMQGPQKVFVRPQSRPPHSVGNAPRHENIHHSRQVNRRSHAVALVPLLTLSCKRSYLRLWSRRPWRVECPRLLYTSLGSLVRPGNVESL